MKKNIAVALVAAMLISLLAGCGGKMEPTETTISESAPIENMNATAAVTDDIDCTPTERPKVEVPEFDYKLALVWSGPCELVEDSTAYWYSLQLPLWFEVYDAKRAAVYSGDTEYARGWNEDTTVHYDSCVGWRCSGDLQGKTPELHAMLPKDVDLYEINFRFVVKNGIDFDPNIVVKTEIKYTDHSSYSLDDYAVFEQEMSVNADADELDWDFSYVHGNTMFRADNHYYVLAYNDYYQGYSGAGFCIMAVDAHAETLVDGIVSWKLYGNSRSDTPMEELNLSAPENLYFKTEKNNNGHEVVVYDMNEASREDASEIATSSVELTFADAQWLIMIK